MELSEILGGAPAPDESASTVETPVETPQPEQVATPEPAPTPTVEQPARPRDEQGRFVKPEPVAQATPEEKPHAVPVQALIEERRKRQELEQRLAALTPKPELKDDDFWQSPAKATEQFVSTQTQALQQEIVNMKYQLAEDLTRSLHTDYDAVRDGFIAKVTAGDPWAVAIAQQMHAQPNPAKFVYDQARKIDALAAVGDLGAFEARIRAEERARFLAEQSRPPPAPDVPRSLNAEPSAPVPSTPDGFTPTPLENILGNRF